MKKSGIRQVFNLWLIDDTFYKWFEPIYEFVATFDRIHYFGPTILHTWLNNFFPFWWKSHIIQVIDIRNVKFYLGSTRLYQVFSFPYYIFRHTKTNKKQEILQQRMYITIPRFFWQRYIANEAKPILNTTTALITHLPIHPFFRNQPHCPQRAICGQLKHSNIPN